MSDVIEFASPFPVEATPHTRAAAVRTDSIHIVFTTVEQTLAAARVAATLGQSMGVPVTLVQFRRPALFAAPSATALEADTDAFVERLRAEGIDVRLRVYVCRSCVRAIPAAFKRHSVIVLAGRGGWWPTRAARLRRRLEQTGHVVLFVDLASRQDSSNA